MDEILSEVTDTDPATDRVEVPHTEEPNGLRLNRRTLFGAGAAGLMGLALTKMSEQPAYAASTMTRSNMTVLPMPSSGQIAQEITSDPQVQKFLSLFTLAGMQFIPERAVISVYEDPGDATRPPGGPCVLAILPSFKAFAAGSASHEAVSIVAVMNCGVVGGVLAGHVLVSHNPFQIQQFSVFEFDAATGAIGEKSVTRDQIKKLTAQKIADMLGRPPVDPAKATLLPSATPANMNFLAAGSFIELLNDSYASPLYPPGAIASLSKDKSLVMKWSEVQRLRYGALFSGITLCTSTTCNACCTSTSTFSISS